MLQRWPDDQFHREIVGLVGLAEVEECGDVGVRQTGEYRRLVAEAPTGLALVEQARGQDLEGDVTAEPLVAGAVDLPHASGTEAFFDPVVGELAIGHEWASWRGGYAELLRNDCRPVRQGMRIRGPKVPPDETNCQSTGVTRTMATSWGATLASKLPVAGSRSFFVHRSRILAFCFGARPISSNL